MTDHRTFAEAELPRRGLLVGGALGLGALLAACTSNEPAQSDATASTAAAQSSGSATPGKPVTIIFSGPKADHGFLAAINSFAAAQAKSYSDVTFKVLEAAADAPSQIAAVQTAIAEKPDALIIFPQDGDQLTGVGKAATAAGIPVINLDRKFNDASAYGCSSPATTTRWASTPAATSAASWARTRTPSSVRSRHPDPGADEGALGRLRRQLATAG
jgi:ABC-type sugar transport system substrate-binding protein